MIQVYTGNGKGKTTAALGLAIRAAGCGMKIYIGQFVKGGSYSELNTLRKIKNITVEQFGRGCFIKEKPETKDHILAMEGLKKIETIILKGFYDIVILDEINIALKFKLLKDGDILQLLKKTPKRTELILTGRCAPKNVLKAADLISHIKEVKHYFKKGIKARRGIEF